MSDQPPFIIANFKANKTWEEVQSWLEVVGPQTKDYKGTVIVCPAFPFLLSASSKIKESNFNLKLGSQDISKFEQGAHTGEVAASQIADAINYAIIGHSERRENFKEDENMLNQKVKNATAANIEPIFCVQDQNTLIPQSVKIVAYEPLFAIGTGNAQVALDAKKVADEIKQKGEYVVLYGGSVDEKNCKSYLQNSFEGFLIGSASLDTQSFSAILKASS